MDPKTLASLQLLRRCINERRQAVSQEPHGTQGEQGEQAQIALRDKLERDHEQAIAMLKSQHEQAIAMLKSQHEQATEALKSKYEQAQTVLRAKLEGDHEQAIAMLKSQHEQAQGVLQDQLDRAWDTIQGPQFQDALRPFGEDNQEFLQDGSRPLGAEDSQELFLGSGGLELDDGDAFDGYDHPDLFAPSFAALPCPVPSSMSSSSSSSSAALPGPVPSSMSSSSSSSFMADPEPNSGPLVPDDPPSPRGSLQPLKYFKIPKYVASLDPDGIDASIKVIRKLDLSIRTTHKILIDKLLDALKAMKGLQSSSPGPFAYKEQDEAVNAATLQLTELWTYMQQTQKKKFKEDLGFAAVTKQNKKRKPTE